MPSFLDVNLFLTGLTGITKTIITSILNGDWCIIPVYFDSSYVVGEVRGGEAVDMLQALNTGHEGSLSTAHANSARDMLSRLETMTLMGVDLPLEAIRRQIASGVDILIHLGRMRDKTRKVLEITEVCGFEANEITIQTLYRWEEGRGLVQTAELCNREKLIRAGVDI